MFDVFLLLLLLLICVLVFVVFCIRALKARTAISTSADVLGDLLTYIAELTPEERQAFAARMAAVSQKTIFTMNEAADAFSRVKMEPITPRPMLLPRNQVYRGWYYRADGTRVEFEQEVKAQGDQGDKDGNA